MIKDIKIAPANYKGYQFEGSAHTMKNLNKINILIGPNNSGKSRFMRHLYVDNRLEFTLRQHDLEKIRQQIYEFRQQVRSSLDGANIQDADDVYKKLSTVQEEIAMFKLGSVPQDLKKIVDVAKYLSNLKNFSRYAKIKTNFSYQNPDIFIDSFKIMGASLLKEIQDSFGEIFDYEIHKIYIPMLRGLRPLRAENEGNIHSHHDYYKERTILDYFSKSDKKEQDAIFTGLSLYKDTRALLLGNKAGRELIKKFEDFLSVHFFARKPVSLIPDITKDVLLIGIGDEEERYVYELGDGIQSLIILLYPLFFNQDKNMLVFIEEPETSLHPGFQRLFLETLMREEFRNFQFFFTTHSNHFLDITLDLEQISVFSFHKSADETKFACTIEGTSNADIRLLDLIGARNSAVFLSNCTIWVEGITDRLYLKKYLAVYQQHLLDTKQRKNAFLEDSHFSFVEYAGSNIVHWAFDDEAAEKIKANRISNKILLLADQDSTVLNPDSAKAKRLKLLKKQLMSRFQVIRGREIENTVSANILSKAIEKLNKSTTTPKWSGRVPLSSTDYSSEKMGDFLENNFKRLTRKYTTPSGTIACKMDFCRTATGLIESINDLSPEGLRLAKTIFSFIEKSNQQVK